MIERERLIDAMNLRDDPAPLALAAEVAMLSLGCGEREEARRGFSLLTRIAPSDPAGWIGLCEVERASGDTDAALAALHEAGLCDRIDAKGRAVVELTRGDLKLRQGFRTEAMEAWQSAFLCDPEGDLGYAARSRIAAVERGERRS